MQQSLKYPDTFVQNWQSEFEYLLFSSFLIVESLIFCTCYTTNVTSHRRRRLRCSATHLNISHMGIILNLTEKQLSSKVTDVFYTKSIDT